MYIVLVPFIGLFLKKRLALPAWISIAVAVAGLYLLSNAGASAPNPGDVMMVGCALAFAVQITFVDRFAPSCDALRLNCIQSLVVTVLSAIFMFLTETPEWSNIAACALPISYAGVLSLGVAYSLQIVGQRHVEPTTASLFMSLESVFAALSGWLLLNERMTARELTGCLLIFLSVLITQIPIKKAP
jgi:drug/metabolite transporter (DMT)-like permease